MANVKSYQDLLVWQKAMDLVVDCYRLTRAFPHGEQFGLTMQIRRAAVSIPANVAEGYGRATKGEYVNQWFEAVAGTIECLPWDLAVSRRWARLVVGLRRKGRTIPLLDAMIAATALEHDLTVATRNVGDFRNAGVRVVDPFA